MDDLTLRYFDAEMRYLREAAKAFAQAHPDRAAMLAEQGRITLANAEEEIARLQHAWQTPSSLPPLAEEIDLFEQRQLETVLEVCRRHRSLSDAGRELFAVSRLKKARPNDADRLRKYLARFGLSWENIRPAT